MSFIACLCELTFSMCGQFNVQQSMRCLKLSFVVGLFALVGCDRSSSSANSPGESVPLRSSAGVPKPEITTKNMEPGQMYVAYCSACHGLELVESQRLDRENWKWVIDDVVNEYGGSWITEREQEILIDYLVEHFGPEEEGPD